MHLFTPVFCHYRNSLGYRDPLEESVGCKSSLWRLNKHCEGMRSVVRYLPMLFAPVLIMSTATAAFSKDEATAQCESPTAMKLYDKGIVVAMINTRSMTMNGKEVTRESVSRMDSAEKEAVEQLAKATDAAILAYRSGLNLYEAKRDVNGKLQLSPGLLRLLGEDLLLLRHRNGWAPVVCAVR